MPITESTFVKEKKFIHEVAIGGDQEANLP
jgi:hypothetical protein